MFIQILEPARKAMTAEAQQRVTSRLLAAWPNAEVQIRTRSRSSKREVRVRGWDALQSEGGVLTDALAALCDGAKLVDICF